jgi:NADH-quinone oxidoreductase subunit C
MLALNALKTNWADKCFLTFLKKIMPIAVKTALYNKDAFMLKTTRTRLFNLLEFLHSHLFSQFSCLVDIIVYDNLSTKYRFAVIYNLLSTTFNSRLSVCVYTNEVLSVTSVCSVYASANWLEREA